MLYPSANASASPPGLCGHIEPMGADDSGGVPDLHLRRDKLVTFFVLSFGNLRAILYCKCREPNVLGNIVS